MTVMSAADSNYLHYRRAYDAGHEKYIKDAINFDKQYVGEQWDEDDKAKIEGEGRPALTINLILPTINTALGEYINQQAVIGYKPARFASHDLALKQSLLAQHIQRVNMYEQKEWQMVCDGFICDRGYFDIRIDFEKNILGDVKISVIDPTEIVLPPDAKEYDPSTWPEVTREYMSSLDDIEAEYGEAKRKEIESLASTRMYLDHGNFAFESLKFGREGGTGQMTASLPNEENRIIKGVRVISRQYRKMTRMQFFIDNATGDRTPVPTTWEGARAQAFANKHGMVIVTQAASRIRWTVSVDSVVLLDDWSIYPTFTIIPYFPFFRRGRPFGYVRNFVSPQEQLNKLSSQELHVVNTTANSGYMVEDGTLTNMSVDELEERGAETGLVISYARGARPPEKIQPNPVPAGIDNISTKSRLNLREISGMEGVLGIGSPEISGVALDRKQQRSSVQVQPPMMNLKTTRLLVGQKILELVQQFYTEERVIHITRDSFDTKNPTEEVRLNAPTPDGQIINDLTIGKYEVAITTQPPRDTFDDVQFAQLVQLREIGVPVPNYMVAQYSTVANKAELAEHIKKLEGMAEPTEQEMALLQKQQEMALQQGELTLAKMEKELEVMASQARLNNAKAEAQEGGVDSPEMQNKMRELEGKIQIQREGNELRRQLAQLSALVKQQSESTRVAAQLATAQYQGQVQRDIAKLSKQMRPQGNE